MQHIEPAQPLAFDCLVHADWSMRAKGRWQTTITRAGDAWLVEAPVLVGDVGAFVGGIAARVGTGAALLGVDLPIGAPAAWAANACVCSFMQLLPKMGVDGPWRDFFTPAATPNEIALTRPFYPARPGGTAQAHLIDALKLTSMNDLRRRVDFDASGKPAASPLFWTMGAAQVGKAAIAFWRDVLQPALASNEGAPSVWPYDGALADLVQPGRLVIAETYPAEVYRWFDLGIAGGAKSKTNCTHRAEDAPKILAAAAGMNAEMTDAARQDIETGFPEGGDDAFDAMIGALGLLQIVQGGRAPGTPADPKVHAVEGWILGRKAGPKH